MTDLSFKTLSGGQRAIPASSIDRFTGGLRGSALRPGAVGYEQARKIWNGMIDRHPGLIVRCANAADVVRAVNFARDHDLLLAVRGGGHSAAGNSVCEGGSLIDLSPLKQTEVDPAKRTIRAGGGLTWAEFDAATQAHGLATTGGVIGSTGIAGLTLGGGIGWLSRLHGLTIDNLLSAEVVTADGAQISASASENPDLFWGLRGGGGNFGIVTGFEYRLHPLGPQVVAGPVFYPMAQARAMFQFYREWAPTLPDWCNTGIGFLTVPPVDMFPAELHNQLLAGVFFATFDRFDQAEAYARPLRTFGKPALDLIGPLPYTTLQTSSDVFFPAGVSCYWKSHYLNGLSDNTVDALIHYYSHMPTSQCALAFHQLGGASGRIGEDATAFSYRQAQFAPSILALWNDPHDAEKSIQWARDCWAALQPDAIGVYVNFLGDEGEARVRAAYGDAKYDRLVALKNKYDPANLFRLNQNIKPSKNGSV